MNTPQIRRLAGLLLIVVPVAFSICFTLLQMLFEYPDILRQPTADVLAKFQAGGSGLVVVWYALTLTAVLFIPLVVLVHRLLAEQEASATLSVATVFGIVAGVAVIAVVVMIAVSLFSQQSFGTLSNAAPSIAFVVALGAVLVTGGAL